MTKTSDSVQTIKTRQITSDENQALSVAIFSLEDIPLAFRNARLSFFTQTLKTLPIWQHLTKNAA